MQAKSVPLVTLACILAFTSSSYTRDEIRLGVIVGNEAIKALYGALVALKAPRARARL